MILLSRMNRYQFLLDLCMGSVCAFSVFTSIIPAGVSSFATKLLFGAILFSVLVFIVGTSISTKPFVIVALLFINYAYSFFKTEFPLWNTNLLFYYPFYIIWMLFVMYQKDLICEWFITRKDFVLFVIRFWCILTAVSAVLPSCYYIKEGGARYFGSFAGSIFRLGPAAVMIQILIIVSIFLYERRSDIYLMLVPMYCFLMGSSRTYLVVGACIFGVSWFVYFKRKRYFYLTIIPIIAITLFIASFSAIHDKVAFTFDSKQYGDIWFRLTSSRSLFWVNDILAWLKQGILNKLLGCGFGFTYIVSGIWGHNDFIELLCSFGIVGVGLYLLVTIKFLKEMLSPTKLPLEIKVLLVLAWFFNAFFNMHYTYFCCLLSYPILVAVINRKWMISAVGKTETEQSVQCGQEIDRM